MPCGTWTGTRMMGGMGFRVKDYGAGKPSFVPQVRAAHVAQKFGHAHPIGAIQEPAIAHTSLRTEAPMPRFRKLAFHRRETL